MLLYAVAIFVSAFLLFLVQPVMAKQILPWFGGSAAVWTTCLVFFQSSLLAGYAYSDLAVHRLAPRGQVRLHSVLLLVSLALLPIIPGADWKPLGSENPSWRILGLLAATIGLPYFLLSTTSPLVQAWFARTRPGASPYRLLAVSNHITQDIASIPLLWIAPLAIYLLTFILCFDTSGWYHREIFLAMAAASIGVMAWSKADPSLTFELILQIGVFCAGLFVAC